MQLEYTRVLTGAPNLNCQRDALKAAGCEHIFEYAAVGTTIVMMSSAKSTLYNYLDKAECDACRVL
jgi:hypothetical protein